MAALDRSEDAMTDVHLARKTRKPSHPPSGLAIPEFPVRLTFRLPESLPISPGSHGPYITVFRGNHVRIRGRNDEHCISLARCFFAEIAKDRVGFSCHAIFRTDGEEMSVRRQLTVTHGALAISGETHEKRRG